MQHKYIVKALAVGLTACIVLGIVSTPLPSLRATPAVMRPRVSGVVPGSQGIQGRMRNIPPRRLSAVRSAVSREELESMLPSKSAEIPAIAQPVTVKLTDGDKEVYLVGISHVSRRSVEQTEAVISAVKPDAVMLELCLARSGLLIKEEDNFATDRDDRAFYFTGKIRLEGLPTGPEFPTQEEVLRWINADLQPGQPLTKPNFDQLVRNTLGLGIFSSVRIAAQAPPPSAVPLHMSRRRILHKILPKRTFIPWELDEDAPKELFPVYPLGDLVLNCTERTGMLATIEAVDLEGDIPRELRDLPQRIATWFKETKSTIRTLLLARKAILDVQPNSKIDFIGGETSRILVSVKEFDTDPGLTRSNTGLEPTVYDGRGAGIMPINFDGYTTPPVPGPDDGSRWISPQGVKWNEWSEVDTRNAPEVLKDYIGNPVASKLGEFLISRFGKFQDKAARKARIRPGEAWQAAFASAVTNRAKMVVLGDELALVTQSKLAKKLFERLALWTSISLATALCGLALQQNAGIAESLPIEDPYVYLYALASIQLLGGWASLYAPVTIMEQFARQKGLSIEEKLEVKTPLSLASEEYLLEGEDTLLSWPGAKEIVLKDRNNFMADTLFRMVRGKPLKTPAYVTFENTATKDVLERFLMGPGEATETNPKGVGLGKYEMPSLNTVVAVVGTAHIHGIREEFERLKRENK